MTRRTWTPALPALLLLAACGSSSNPSPDSGPGRDTLGTPGFKEDPRATTGATVYATVDLSDPSAPVATLWAARLGPVLGIALRLKLDPARISAQSPRIESCLGPDAPKEARYLIAARAEAVSLGAVRRGPAAGEKEISGAVKLATIPLSVVSAGRSRLELEDLQVRRADGTFVPVKPSGGELTAGGAP